MADAFAMPALIGSSGFENTKSSKYVALLVVELKRVTSAPSAIAPKSSSSSETQVGKRGPLLSWVPLKVM
jgi:hypothetical protein